MLILTHHIGFGAGGSGNNSTGAEINRTLGTNIGNMTSGGNLAASFDGTTSQAGAACSGRTGANGYVGKTGNIARVISKVTCYGGNNTGFYADDEDPSTTLTLYGKQGSAPANGTDGTSLGSINFTDTTNESAGRTITSSDLVTYWDHWWVYMTGGSGASEPRFAELRFYE